MTEYHNVEVNLLDSQLDKLKSAEKDSTIQNDMIRWSPW